MSDYVGSNFISQPVQEALDANTALITGNTTDIGTNTSGLSQEVIDRTNADANLQTQINNSASAGALQAETTARIAGDSALQTQVTTNATNLTTEISDRQSADSVLQNDINTRALNVDLNTEISNRTAADTALNVLISNNTANITTNANNLATEISDRQTADNNLQNDINDRALILSLNNEITARQSADTSLQNAISYETSSRINADNALQTDINTKANLTGGNTFTGEQIVDNIVVNGDIKGVNNQDLNIASITNGTNVTAFTIKPTGETELDGHTTFKKSIIGGISQSLISGVRVIDSTRLITKLDTRAGNITATISNGVVDGQIKIISLHRADPTQYTATLLTNVSEQITLKNVGEGVILAWSGNTADWSVVAKNLSFLNNDLSVDGDVNLTAGKAYKIDNVSIPTNADLNLKAPIDNASLTGNTQMTRLTVNHSDSTTIGLDFNNTNVNQYAGAFNTAGYGWQFFNDNTSQVNNVTFSVNTKGSGAYQTPLLIKNDAKLYTLDQEVDGDINLTTGHEFKINGTPIGGGLTPQQEADLDANTVFRTGLLGNLPAVQLINVDCLYFRINCNLNTISNIEAAFQDGQLPQIKVQNLITDLAAKRAITNNSFTDLELNGTKQTLTSSGGTINATDYFTEFNLTGQTADLIVDIAETEYIGQTKIVYIQTEGSANLIIRGSFMLTDQDVILRKKGDCVFLQAEWNTSRWKVLGIHSNSQPTLTTTGNLTCGNDIITSRHLFSNSAVVSEISGFSSINLRTPTERNVPDILIDGVSSFRKKYSPCLIEHRQPSGTNGGSSIQNTWNDITLNEIDLTGRTDYTLSGNQFTVIEPGTYTLSFRASCYGTHGTKAEVIGVTNNLKKVQGVSIHTGTQSGGICSGSGEFQTQTANQVFKLRMYTQNGQGNNGLGIAVGIANETECFAQVHIQRLF